MTREEQIIEKAKEYYDAPNLQMRVGFIEGAKWADENPNLYNDEKYHTVKVSCLDELNRKAALYDVFLDKACKWLNKYASDYAFSVYDEDDACSVSMDLVDDFKKAMEQL